MECEIRSLGTLASSLSLIVKEHELSKVCFEVIRNRMEKIAENFKDITKDTADIMLAGSSYDDLNLTRLWKNDEGNLVFFPAIDFDITMSYAQFKIEDMSAFTSNDVDDLMIANLTQTSGFFALMLSTDDPRFAKIKVTNAGRRMLERPSCKINELIDKDGYIPNYIFKVDLFPELFQDVEVLYRREKSVYIEAGPALSNVEHDQQGYTYDFVHSFPVPVWPTVASKWITRHRPCQWPSEDMISAIKKGGCALVPVGSHSSIATERNLEWRISFTSAERMLARSLTRLQRTCYCVVKLMLKTCMPPEAAFSSYHLKNMMFWFCEQQYHISEWTTDTLGDRILQFLQYVLKALEHNYIPHYILSKSNLIAHRPQEEIDIAKETISGVIAVPYKTLMTVCNKIHCFDVQLCSEQIHGQNEVQAMLLLYTTFVQTMYKSGLLSLPQKIAEDFFQLVVQLNDSVKLYIRKASQIFSAKTLSELLKPLAIAYTQDGKMDMVLALYQMMISSDHDNVVKNYPETLTNIACIYSCKAETSSAKKEKEELEINAVDNFKLALKYIEDSASLHLAYGNFLLQSKRSLKDAIEHFRKATYIENPREDDEAFLQMQLPDNQSFVERQVYVPGKIAAYHMLIHLLVGLNDTYEARIEALNMEKEANVTKLRYRELALQVCGLCYRRIGLVAKGNILLETAVKYHVK